MYLSLCISGWDGTAGKCTYGPIIEVPQVCSKYTIYLLRQQFQRRSNMYVYVQQV